MSGESQIPIVSAAPKRFAASLALFYGAVFTLIGAHMPFFPVWLKAVGIDASWIGIITAVPAVTRFTVLPFVTSLAESRASLRSAMIVTAFMTALGFAAVGTQHQPLLVFLAFVATACMWTPIVPLTDAYALRGVARYGLKYGPLRLWGSAAFVVGALACGLLVDLIAARYLIWVIAALAAFGAAGSLGLKPLDKPKTPPAALHGATALLRESGFVVIMLASALIQGSHAAYYTFASINWQLSGLGGLTIAGLWVLGVLAEIVVFALSPRFTLQPSALVVIGAIVRRGTLADHRAGAIRRGACGGPTGAWTELWADPSGHHGTSGAPCARAHHGERAGLSRGLLRHRRRRRVDPVRRGLCPIRAGRLLRHGRDGIVGCDPDVAGAALSRFRAKWAPVRVKKTRQR